MKSQKYDVSDFFFQWLVMYHGHPVTAEKLISLPIFPFPVDPVQEQTNINQLSQDLAYFSENKHPVLVFPMGTFIVERVGNDVPQRWRLVKVA